MSGRLRLRSRTVLIVAVGALLLFSAVLANAATMSPQDAKANVERNLTQHSILTNGNITVTVADGIVTLDGTVNSLRDVSRAEKYAHRAAEDYAIVSNLKVPTGKVPDDQIAEQLAKKIGDYAFYSIFDWVSIDIKDGVATLRGWAHEAWLKRAFARQAEKVAGITKIVNDIQVLPVSQFDDEIRHRAAEAIYDSPAFEPYLYGLNPPVHIIADNGVVHLEGYVDSSIQSGTAENLAYIDTNAFKVINDLRVGGQ
jgi:hyperosmotically inducible protein